MSIIEIKDLPPPPDGKTGWPWTEGSVNIVNTKLYKAKLPRISIVTPSYNQGEYIEETIRSVLLQGYPNLEYMIFDGGSNDGTIDIIKKYETWLDHWVSEPDDGQSSAINKGWKKSSGEILAWLNSDDIYCKDAFQMVVSHNIGNISGLTYGDCEIVNNQSEKKGMFIAPPPDKNTIYRLWHCWEGEHNISQPATFFSRETLNKTGFLNEKYHFAMDYDLLLRMSLKGTFSRIESPLACFRIHSASKSSLGVFGIEMFGLLLKSHRKTAKAVWGDNYIRLVRKNLADINFSKASSNNQTFLDNLNVIFESIEIYPYSFFSKGFFRTLLTMFIGIDNYNIFIEKYRSGN